MTRTKVLSYTTSKFLKSSMEEEIVFSEAKQTIGIFNTQHGFK